MGICNSRKAKISTKLQLSNVAKNKFIIRRLNIEYLDKNIRDSIYKMKDENVPTLKLEGSPLYIKRKNKDL